MSLKKLRETIERRFSREAAEVRALLRRADALLQQAARKRAEILKTYGVDIESDNVAATKENAAKAMPDQTDSQPPDKRAARGQRGRNQKPVHDPQGIRRDVLRAVGFYKANASQSIVNVRAIQIYLDREAPEWRVNYHSNAISNALHHLKKRGLVSHGYVQGFPKDAGKQYRLTRAGHACWKRIDRQMRTRRSAKKGRSS